MFKYINLPATSTCIALFIIVSFAHYQIITNQMVGSYGVDREKVHFGTLFICLLLVESSWDSAGPTWLLNVQIF